jgi:hypothetical protein
MDNNLYFEDSNLGESQQMLLTGALPLSQLTQPSSLQF